MTGDYTIAVSVDDWSATINRRDVTDPAADAVTISPLTVTWSMTGPYPSQPTPTTATFGLYVPDVATGPRPAQGSRVALTITTPDAALPDVAAVLEFDGLITDLDAGPRGDGLAFNITATDYTSQLGEERVGDVPWPATDRYDRLLTVRSSGRLDLQILDAERIEMELGGIGPDVAARDVDAQRSGDILADLFSAAATWMGDSPSFWITGYVDGSWTPPRLATWVRPMISQYVSTLTGQPFAMVAFIPGGLPDVDAAFPYTVDLVGGELTMVRKAITPDTSLVAWIPATAIEADSVTWRQDKGSNTNRVRATGPDFVTKGLAHVGSLVAEFTDLVDANGPNEIAVSLDAAQTDYTETTDLIYALLGTHYDASPRWTFDEITIRADEIPDGDQWPRLFNPREHNHIYDQAAGKFVLITDIAEKWNLHDRADYFGRLAGATLTLSGGIRWTAKLAHRLPVGGGVESATDTPVYAPFPGTYTGPPTHHPITCAELAAGANPTVAQCGDLTPADLQLVEG